MHTQAARLATVVMLLCVSLAACSRSDARSLTSPAAVPTREQAVEDYLRSEAEALGITEPPEVQIVRLITSDEWLDQMIKCLNEAGIQAAVSPDGTGLSFGDVPPELRTDQVPLAIYVCEAQYPLDPEFGGPPSENELRAQYLYVVRELIPCLVREEEGLKIRDIPSETRFLVSGGEWGPYEQVIESLGVERAAELMVLCPQVPR